MPYIKGKFVVSLWTRATSHNKTHRLKSIDQKLMDLEAVVKATQSAVGRAGIVAGANGLPFTAILAAPEYFFTHPDPDKRAPIDEATKLRVEQGFFTISAKYPGILMFPGTIFYCKTAIRQIGHTKINADGQTFQTTQEKNRHASAFGRLDSEFKEHVPGNRARTGFDTHKANIEASTFNPNPDGAHLPSLKHKKEVLKNNPNAQLLRNSTGIYLSGKRHGKYDKQADCWETFFPDDMVFVQGTKNECPTIGDCKFGVEICVDHNIGRLKKRNVQDLHFHIVLSDWVATEEGHMSMCNEGYFLHASSNHAETKLVYRDANGALHERPKQNLLPNHTDKLSYYTEDWTWGVPPQWVQKDAQGGGRTAVKLGGKRII